MSTEPAIQTTGHRATLRSLANAIAICTWAIWCDWRYERAQQRAFERRFPLNPARVARRERLITTLIAAVGLVAIAAVLVDIFYLGSLSQ